MNRCRLALVVWMALAGPTFAQQPLQAPPSPPKNPDPPVEHAPTAPATSPDSEMAPAPRTEPLSDTPSAVTNTVPATSAAPQAPPPNASAAALFNACETGDLNQVKALLDQGAPIDGQSGKHGLTPLIGAADGHFVIMNFLIGKHAKLDFPDYEGGTPLLHACWADSTDIALALISAGADVNFPSNAGRTPLMFASMKGNDQIVTALIAHKVKLDANCDQGPAILWAAANDKLSTIKLLAAAGANLNLLPNGGAPTAYTILARAAANNDLEMITYLVGQKVDVNAPGADGATPLMAAAEFGCTKAMEQLIVLGGKIDVQNEEGNSVLMLSKGINTMQVLLQNKPKLELKNKKGMTALLMAANRNNIDQVRALIDAGGDVNATDNRGETALTIAGDIGNTDMVQLLKDKGAKRTDIHIIAKGDPPEPLSPARAWALAVSAIYAQRFGLNPKLLDHGDTALTEQNILRRDWNIVDKAGLFAELDKMRDSGLHAVYQSEGLKFSQMSDDEFTKYLIDHPDKTTEIKALRASYAKWKEKSGLAWDICRSANLINLGYAARYLTEDEAWERLMVIARQAQASFNSWQEISDNFLDAREIWANKRDPQFEACAKLLLDPQQPNSPWNQNPWKTDLSAQPTGN